MPMTEDQLVARTARAVPVVVRVPTVLPPGVGLDKQKARQRVELDVVSWLATEPQRTVHTSI